MLNRPLETGRPITTSDILGSITRIPRSAPDTADQRRESPSLRFCNVDRKRGQPESIESPDSRLRARFDACKCIRSGNPCRVESTLGIPINSLLLKLHFFYQRKISFAPIQLTVRVAFPILIQRTPQSCVFKFLQVVRFHPSTRSERNDFSGFNRSSFLRRRVCPLSETIASVFGDYVTRSISLALRNQHSGKIRERYPRESKMILKIGEKGSKKLICTPPFRHRVRAERSKGSLDLYIAWEWCLTKSHDRLPID